MYGVPPGWGSVPPPVPPPGDPPYAYGAAIAPPRIGLGLGHRPPPPGFGDHHHDATRSLEEQYEALARARVFDACDELRPHPALLLAAADSASPLPPPGPDARAAVRRAVDARLREMRRAFVRGEPIRAPREVPRCALAFAIVSDVLDASSKGVFGAERSAAVATRVEARRAPRSSAIAAIAPAPLRGAPPDGYRAFFAKKILERVVRDALVDPSASMCGPSSGRVSFGGTASLDFGIQRLVVASSTRPEEGGGGRRMRGDDGADAAGRAGKSFSYAAAAAGAAKPPPGSPDPLLAAWTDDNTTATRTMTLTNDTPDGVLLLAITAAPHLPGVFRARCDYPELIRHASDDAPPFEGRPPVYVPPGGAFDVTVELGLGLGGVGVGDARAKRKTGCVAQWVMAAFARCPNGWTPPPSAAAAAADAFLNGDFSDGGARASFDPFDARNVEVVGRRVGALLVAAARGGSKRSHGDGYAELASVLDPETPAFVPTALRDAHDTFPTVTLAPVTLVDESPWASSELRSTNLDAARWCLGETSAREAFTLRRALNAALLRTAAVAAPAAFKDPKSSHLPPAYWTQPSENDGDDRLARWTPHREGGEWDDLEVFLANAGAGGGELARWSRLLRVEERQQLRYDLHDVALTHAGTRAKFHAPPRGWDPQDPRTTDVLAGGRVARADLYALRVPGLVEGFPPVVVGDVLRVRVASARAGITRHDERADAQTNERSQPHDHLFARRVADVGVVVQSVVPRAGVVVVAAPRALSRPARPERNPNLAWKPEEAIAQTVVTEMTCHVRFAIDHATFRAQRRALAAAAANAAIGVALDAMARRRAGDASAPRASESCESSRPPSDDAVATPSTEAVVAHLNDEQRKVVLDVLRGDAERGGRGRGVSPYCVLGPPGTGKTVTVVAAAAAALASDPRARVLLVAPAAFAADVVCSRLCEFMRADAAAAAGFEPFARPSKKKIEVEKGGGRGGEGAEGAEGVEGADTSDDDDEPSTSPAWTWTIARVNDPRRDPSSVKKDVLPFCVAADAPVARRARVVVASCASAGLLADAYVDDVVARWTVADGALSPGTIDVPYPDAATAAAERAAFTHVFVDEAGQATTPETLVPLRLATRRTSVVLSGDPAQLGPTVHSVVAGRGRCDDDDDDDDDGDGEMTPGLTTSMLEMASGGGCGARATRLVRNYRSHRDIIDLSSRLFYRDGLVACAREETTALPRVLTSAPSTSTRGAGSGLPLAATRGNESLGFVDDDQDDDDDDDDEGHLAAAAAATRSRVVFYAVKGAQTRESARGDSPSYYNPIEAHALVELLAGWLDRDAARGDDADAAKDGGAGASAVYASPRLRASDVGVIAPYRAQVLRLRLLLRGRGLGAVRVGTVDDYQGQEEKVVFISATATRTPHPALLRAAGMTTGGGQLGFLACPRRFNVATTRAKCLNVVVGHPGALSHWPHWAALLRRCALAGACFGPGMDDGSDVGQNRQNADRRGGSYPHPGPGGDDVGAAVAALAELSLLGGGAAEAEEDDDAMARSAFSEEQAWRVAL